MSRIFFQLNNNTIQVITSAKHRLIPCAWLFTIVKGCQGLVVGDGVCTIKLVAVLKASVTQRMAVANPGTHCQAGWPRPASLIADRNMSASSAVLATGSVAGARIAALILICRGATVIPKIGHQ